MRNALVILLIVFTRFGFGQECHIKDIRHYQDTLEILEGFTTYIFFEEKDEWTDLFTNISSERNYVPLSYYLVPDYVDPYEEDGRPVPVYTHIKEINSITNVMWVEVSKLNRGKNKTQLELSIYQNKEGGSKLICLMEFVVSCKTRTINGNPQSYMVFKKKKFKVVE